LRILTTALLVVVFPLFLAAQPGESNFSVSKPMFLPIEKTIFYQIGDRSLPVKIFQYGNVKDIICINVHDNEGTSVQAAKSILEEKGGTLIKIENNKQRVIYFRLKGIKYGFDPNRMFSRIGIEQTLRDNRRISREAMDEVEKFAQRILQLLPDTASCIIALHNNTEEAYSVKSYLSGSNRQYDAKAVYKDSLQDVDDIAFTTDSILYQKMADSGFNSIWQDNEHAKRDGSLSIYFGERNKRYINIETQHGRVDQYMKMFAQLLMILEGEKKNPKEIAENPQ